MSRRPPVSCACSKLRRASRAITQLYDDALAACDLRVTQFALMTTLDVRGTTTISALASALLLDRTALSRNLEPLQQRGLVDITPGTDARTREARLTPAGRRALQEAAPRWEAVQRDVAKRIGADRLQTLYDVLADLERLHPATQRIDALKG
jgi:DNA-binding MarR family transcriptional regulator